MSCIVSWLLFALLSTVFEATSDIMDKFILNRYKQPSTSYLVSLIIIQQIFAALIFIRIGANFVYPDCLLAIGAGFIQAGFWLSFLKAMQVEDVSKVSAMSFVYPLFIFIAAGYLLGESLSLNSYLGATLIVISAVILSYRRTGVDSPLVLSPALKYVFLFWVFSILYSIYIKYMVAFMDEWHLYMWSSVGTLIAAILLMTNKGIRDDSLMMFTKGPFVVASMFSEEVFDFLARIFIIFAYAEGSASLVSSVRSIQPLIVLLLVLPLNLFLPSVLNEELNRKSLASKFTAVILVALGFYLIS